MSLSAYASYFEPEPDGRYTRANKEDAPAREERDVKDVIRMLHANHAEEEAPSKAPAPAPTPAPASAPAERYEEALEGFVSEQDFAPLWPNDEEAHAGAPTGAGARDVRRLLNKMDHVLHLIEDSRAGTNVTEELILYCFLGIFVIFLVDSFLHAGKTYHR